MDSSKTKDIRKDFVDMQFNTKLPDGFIKPSERVEFDSTIFNPHTTLTKGEEIAVRAMSAMLSNPEIADRTNDETMEAICRRAIYMADIMMKSFNERSNGY